MSDVEYEIRHWLRGALEHAALYYSNDDCESGIVWCSEFNGVLAVERCRVWAYDHGYGLPPVRLVALEEV